MTDAIWATIADVTSNTGKVVSQDKINEAQGDIETACGAIASLTVGLINAADLHWLELATCYQAAWLADNPDARTRHAVSSAAQDGQSASYRRDALTLADQAKRALHRLSWRGTRSLAPQGRVGAVVAQLPDDDLLPWKPL